MTRALRTPERENFLGQVFNFLVYWLCPFSYGHSWTLTMTMGCGLIHDAHSDELKAEREKETEKEIAASK